MGEMKESSNVNGRWHAAVFLCFYNKFAAVYFGFEFPAIFSCADCAYAACFICAVNGINRVDEAEELPLDEWRRQFFCLNSLGEIAKQMGKHDFDFSLNPCDGNPNWTSEMHLYKYNNTLVYVCSYPGGVCHVVAISLKGQDLESVLPSSLAKLHYISDLNGNTSQFLNLG
ncbi:hypothetical protein Lser_V15G45152 [Lactuca serriola]